ncbi:MAG: flagellar hook-basal body complex protein FliE [Candidatus Thermoplasmatota archaeon]|jgi:dephospho-CoA kinase|nr:flagellar hook-basal body complex protein FliE [Candidatus Thermoplasmatota archaeon]MCL5983978.1 flagellar hook-basal body complex protein FliE [Candidatus Thermoplasmatota archaeon]
MKLAVTVGMPGSGKDELVNVAKSLGFHVIKMGDLVRSEAQRRKLQLNDQNLGRIANEEREKHGASIWAKRVIPLVTETKTLIDGCRSNDELDLLRHHFGDLVLIGIHSSPETRFERLSRRARGDDSMSFEAFYERDRRELKFGIGNALAMADHMIVNEGAVQDLRRQADEVLREVLE